MSTSNNQGGTDELWLTLTELAKREGVVKSVASERVTAFEAARLIKTKIGPRRSKLIELSQYLAARRATGDAAREAGAATKAADIDSPHDMTEATTPTAPAYRDAQTREKQIATYLKELELRERLGQLVPATDLEAVANKVGEVIVRVIDRIPSHADAVAAAVAKDGTLGAKARLKEIAREIRVATAAAMLELAKLAPSPASLDQLETLEIDAREQLED